MYGKRSRYTAAQSESSTCHYKRDHDMHVVNGFRLISVSFRLREEGSEIDFTVQSKHKNGYKLFEKKNVTGR
jgi:hypothetical protein